MPQSSPALQLLVMADHLINNEAQEFLAELGIEIRIPGQAAQPRDLGFLAAGIGRRQAARRLVAADRLGLPHVIPATSDARNTFSGP